MPSLDKPFPEPFSALHDRSPLWGHRVRVVDSRAMQRVGGRQCSSHCHVHVVDSALALVFPDSILPATCKGVQRTLVVALRPGKYIAVVYGPPPQ